MSVTTEMYVELLTGFQRPLYLYIVTLLRGTADAADILQAVNMVLWSKKDEFEPGSNFSAWAYRIAYFEVMAFRKQLAKRGRLLFSSELMQVIAEERNQDAEVARLEERRRALDGCLDKLRDRDRDLLTRRYYIGSTVKELAAEVGRPLNSIYQSLERVRITLLECIQHTLAANEVD